MMRLAMSPAAVGLFRALLARSGAPRDRILLTEWRSVDWQSLTFVGERHEVGLRISGPGSDTIVACLTDQLADAEFDIAGQIVADIALVGAPERAADGSTTVNIEALTIAAA
jgi:hypothetical protein